MVILKYNCRNLQQSSNPSLQWPVLVRGCKYIVIMLLNSLGIWILPNIGTKTFWSILGKHTWEREINLQEIWSPNKQTCHTCLAREPEIASWHLMGVGGPDLRFCSKSYGMESWLWISHILVVAVSLHQTICPEHEKSLSWKILGWGNVFLQEDFIFGNLAFLWENDQLKIKLKWQNKILPWTPSNYYMEKID